MFKAKGYVAISTVLILTSVIMSLAVTSALLSIGEAQSGLSLFKGEDNLTFAEGCVEDYLLKIRSNGSFPGGNVTRPEGTCTITITSNINPWDITVYSLSPLYQRKIRVTFNRTSTGMSLLTWREIP